MSKLNLDRKNKENQQPSQMLEANGENSNSLTPPAFQLKAEAPVQMSGPKGAASHEKGYDLTASKVYGKSISGEKSKEWGEQPEDKEFKTSAELYSGEKEWKGSTLSKEEQEAAVKGPYAEGAAKANYSVSKDGIKAGAEAEGKAMLFEIDKEFPLTFDHKIFDEDMQMFLALIVKGFAGVEAKAAIEANVAKAAASGDPKKVNKSSITASAEAGASAFAGAKLSIGGKAAYKWNKKDVSAYKGKIKQSAGMITDAILMINPPLGWLLKKMGADKAASFLVESIFGMGSGKGWTDLASAEAHAEGSAGIGGEAKAGGGFENGKFSFYASAKATWGLGFGTSVKVALDILEGVKFGLIAGGEIWSRAKAYLAELLDPKALLGYAGTLFSGIMDWFGADDKIREMVRAGAHTIAPAEKRAEMIKTLMSGWCGEEDQDAIIDILRYSKRNGDIGRVVGIAGKRSILWKLDGKQDTMARALMG